MSSDNILRIACDGESASGKSTAARLISKKYKLYCLNSGLLFRYASFLTIKYKPKKKIIFLKKKFKNLNYKKIKKINLHTQQISNHVAILAKKKNVRNIVKIFQKKVIKKHYRICFEGRESLPQGMPTRVCPQGYADHLCRPMPTTVVNFT